MWYEQFAGHTGGLETVIGNIYVPLLVVGIGWVVWDIITPLIEHFWRVRK